MQFSSAIRGDASEIDKLRQQEKLDLFNLRIQPILRLKIDIIAQTCPNIFIVLDPQTGEPSDVEIIIKPSPVPGLLQDCDDMIKRIACEIWPMAQIG